MVVFRVLGMVEAEVDGRPLDVGHARQKYVLAALLMDVNKVVPAEELVRRAWDDDAPQRATGTLQTYITRLRRSLDGVASIARKTGGYSLVVDDSSSVDAHQFAQLIDRARSTSDQREAAELFARALGLWRGEALAGLDSEWAASTREWLAGQRLAAELDHTDLRLALGQHSDLLPELRGRAGKHPLDERVASQLMLALYRAGQQAEALAHYWAVRTALADELGIDPGPTLQDLYQRILTADAGLAAPAPPRRAAAAPTVPRQLPATPAGFSGRATELTAVTDALAGNGDTVPIVTITGSGGIGKTALTLRWAHQHSARFPDGQLYVNLRGFDPTSPPMSPGAAVRAFLNALNVPESAVPAELDAQTALFRSLVADRRVLIVLDNAADAAQVTPLLPGGPGCAVLITSRDRLSALVNMHGARPLALDVLGESAARALLAGRIGAQRLDIEPEAAAELLAYCGGFPLALSIVAGRALTRPGLPLAALSEELRDATTRLGVLDEDDPGSGITAVLACSYHALTPDHARLFVSLGLMPGPDIGRAAAASLIGVHPAEAGPALRALERLSLVQQELPGRWRMHDVVRLYAVNQGELDQTEAEREAALRRLTSYYLNSARSANDALDRQTQTVDTEPLMPGVHPEQIDKAHAMSWFDAERLCLLAAQQLAVDRDWYATAFQLGWWMTIFHYRRALYQDYLTTWQNGLAVSAHLDAAARAIAHRSLGRAYSRVRRFPESLAHLNKSLEIAEADENYADQVRTHQALGLVHGGRLKDHATALVHFTEALRLAEQLHHQIWQAEAHNEIALCLATLKRFDEARPHSEQALSQLRAAGDRDGEADVMDNMGLIAYQAGDYQRAVAFYRQCIDAYREQGNINSTAAASERLGNAYRALAEHDQAREALWQALELFRLQERELDVERVLVQINEISASVRH
ncbi:MAG TPA: BTAD domain-containing putative transcriptional regulator [Pseudonocardiaceae bacterium]|nr:BTAD domain-containing putative transcriptional regulator [Pseudonocardiaceae bacterium]